MAEESSLPLRLKCCRCDADLTVTEKAVMRLSKSETPVDWATEEVFHDWGWVTRLTALCARAALPTTTDRKVKVCYLR